MPDRNFKDHEWARLNENSILRALEQGQGLAQQLDLHELQRAQQPLRSLSCCDPRVPGGMRGKIGMAGSLILAPPEQVDAFVNSHRGAIEEVTSHHGCAAASLCFAQLREAGRLPQGVETDMDLAAHFARGIAERLGARHRHLGRGDMNSSVNTARAIWVDATGSFRPDLIVEMPPHFLASAAGHGFTMDYVATEVGVLASIALGEPGFGERFTSTHPFFVFIAAKDDADLDQLTSALQPVVAAESGRIKIHGIVLPRATA